MPRRERVRMLLRVQDLLVLDSFHGSRVIAGHRGLNRVVEDIPIMEEPNIEHFVKSGDFLCTTLYPIYNDKQRLTDFIPNLVRLGLAGLGIKPNRYVSEVPQVFIGSANALDFPVILLPADQSLSSQINAFLKESLHRKSRELEYRDEIHNKLMSIMLQGEEYDGLAYNLAKLVRKNVALYSARGEKLAEYRPDEDFDFEDCCADSGNWLDQLSMNEDFKQLQQDAGCTVLYRVYYGHEKAGYIVMSSRFTFSLTPMERMGVEQFGMAFRVMIQHQRMLAELEYRYREEFTCDLLFGKIESEQSARSRARALEWEMNFPMSIFLIDVQTNDKVYNKVDVLHALQERALPELVRGHSANAVFLSTTGKYIVVFLDMPTADCPEKAIKIIDGVLNGLQVGYATGISRAAAQLRQIPKAYQESKDAMYIARLTGPNRALYFRDIGLYRVLHAARDPKELQEFCQDTLGPLMRYDAQNNTELLATLDMILTCGGNLKETARRMFVHYNTVRYRQRLIEEQLDKKLANLDDYQTLNLAMKIHHMWP